MTYGINTHSFLNSPEHHQMQAERKEQTDRHLGLCACGAAAITNCAWKLRKWEILPGGRERCDRPICGECAKQVGDGKFIGPCHYEHYDKWKQKQHEQGNLFQEAA